jgi:hypothetical protein
LWNWRLSEKCLTVKICQAIRGDEFSIAKGMNSNQLGNSLGINIGGMAGKSNDSRFGVLHILGLLAFRFCRPAAR